MQIVGERLRALREGMKLSQMKIAEMLGVPQTSVARYENGSYTPTAEHSFTQSKFEYPIGNEDIVDIVIPFFLIPDLSDLIGVFIDGMIKHRRG